MGDAAGFAASSYVVLQAYRMGASMSVLTKMVFNVMLEVAIGVIPVVGDLFDFMFKANKRNVALLENELDSRLGRGDVVEERKFSISSTKAYVALAALAGTLLLVLAIALWIGYEITVAVLALF